MLDEILGIALRDNVKARRLQTSGAYAPVVPAVDGEPAIRSQMLLIETARRAAEGKPPEIQPVIRHATVTASIPAPAQSGQ